MVTIIQNGTLVTGARSYSADIRIESGKIAAIGPQLPTEGCEVFDASGCKIFPGFIDAHTHLDMDTGTALTADDFASGTKAALAGGTTALVDFATQDRGSTLKKALETWHEKALGKSWCDYGFHMAVTDWNENVCGEIEDMAKAGVTSFKVYMAYDNLRLSDGHIYNLMKKAAEIGGLVSCHCENGDLVNNFIAENRAKGNRTTHFHPLSRPDYMEAEAIERFCCIGRAADAPVYIVHLSTRVGLLAALKAQEEGVNVLIESCPQYFVLDDSVYDLPEFEGAKFVCSPPLRKKEDQSALWEALGKNQIHTICTDHCSFNFKGQKEQGKDDYSQIPNGMPGLEHRPALMYTHGVLAGKITENQMAATLSEQPAALFGMTDKGGLTVGKDADIVIWDPSVQRTVTAADMYQNVDYTPCEGMQLTGWPKAVFLRGQLAAQDGKVSEKPLGSYVSRGPSSAF